LLEVDFTALLAFNDASIFEIDEVLLLQRPQLVEHLICGVQSIKAENDQIAHCALLS
jgi:hypothetical protein